MLILEDFYMAKNEIISNFSSRWRPDFRYRDDKKIDIKLDLPRREARVMR